MTKSDDSRELELSQENSAMAETQQQTERPSIPFDEWEHREMHPAKDFVNYVQNYARQKPDVAALCCFGIGFVLGWKVKPW
jgi:hypothetical protein